MTLPSKKSFYCRFLNGHFFKWVLASQSVTDFISENISIRVLIPNRKQKFDFYIQKNSTLLDLKD